MWHRPFRLSNLAHLLPPSEMAAIRKPSISLIKHSKIATFGDWRAPIRPDPMRSSSPSNPYTICWETKFVSTHFVIRIFISYRRNSSQPNSVYGIYHFVYEISSQEPFRIDEFRLKTDSYIRISSPGIRNCP